VALARPLLTRILAQIGKEGKKEEPDNIKQLRSVLLNALVFLCPDPDTIAYLVGLWNQFLTDRASVDANIYSILLRVGAAHANGFDRVLEMSRSDPNPEVKSQAGIALGSSPPDRTQEVLTIGLNAQLQDVVFFLVGVALNPGTGRALWDFLKPNWPTIFKMFETISFNIPMLVDWGTEALTTVEEAKEVEDFFAANPTPVADRSIKQAVLAIQNRAAIRARDKEAVAAVFAKPK
jgi:hypothetical protein